MEDTSAEEHVVRLSSLDHFQKAAYISCCLCFPYPNGHDNVESITTKFAAAVKRTITHLPILAGRVRAARTENSHSGYLEVAIQPDDISNFQSTCRHLTYDDFPHDLASLEKAGVPSSAFVNEKLAPVADTLPAAESPVFATQVNLLSGGVLVVLHLHHSVGDIVSLSTIATHLSSDLPTRKITNDDLRYEALEQSRLRDRLSGSRGVKSDIVRNAYRGFEASTLEATPNSSSHSAHLSCRILVFDLKLLAEVTSLITQRFQYIHGDRAVQLSSFDALAAVLWKGIGRALLSQSEHNQDAARLDSISRLFMPLNVRKTIEPALDDSYFGNATIPVVVSSPIVQVSMPFEPGTLARTARSIRAATQDVSEQLVRSIITGINESTEAKSLMATNHTTDVLVTSWADLSLEKAHVGLGLGPPKWVRKASSSLMADGCTIYPPHHGGCEVSVQLTENVMAALLDDENFMVFVDHVV